MQVIAKTAMLCGGVPRSQGQKFKVSKAVGASLISTGLAELPKPESAASVDEAGPKSGVATSEAKNPTTEHFWNSKDSKDQVASDSGSNDQDTVAADSSDQNPAAAETATEPSEEAKAN